MSEGRKYTDIRKTDNIWEESHLCLVEMDLIIMHKCDFSTILLEKKNKKCLELSKGNICHYPSNFPPLYIKSILLNLVRDGTGNVDFLCRS